LFSFLRALCFRDLKDSYLKLNQIKLEHEENEKEKLKPCTNLEIEVAFLGFSFTVNSLTCKLKRINHNLQNMANLNEDISVQHETSCLAITTNSDYISNRNEINSQLAAHSLNKTPVSKFNLCNLF
jgi:hypothetical protein